MDQPPTNSNKTRIAIVINFLTSYRESFYRELLSKENLEIEIFCHKVPQNINLQDIHERFGSAVCIVRGRFLFGEKFVYSHLPWRRLIEDFDLVYVEGNPRYISHAVVATMLRIVRKPVVIWAMVYSFRNSRLGLSSRLAWYRLFDKILVYSDCEADDLRAFGFGGRIIGINNGIDYEGVTNAIGRWSQERLVAWRKAQKLDGHLVLLSCARLETKNKFWQVLCVLPELIRWQPKILWCVIGDGVEKAFLDREVERLGLRENVRFLGSIYDLDEQAPWFLSSCCLVHPGAIGLTLLQAFSFRLPVVTHGQARHHGPEFAAMLDGVTGVTYVEDSLAGLEKAIKNFAANNRIAARMGLEAEKVVKNKFNTKIMVKRFLEFVDR